MKYEVWLGDIEIYGVETVEESAARKIAIYDSVGAGKFPQAESRGLHEWEIKCELAEHNDRHLKNWSEASDIFKSLHSLLDKKTPARLVIRSDCGRTSERVLLKSFSKEETFSGVYAVKISCTEYVAAAVKTTDVPFVARPGKIPELPETVTISYKGDGSGMTPYELTELAKQNDVDAQWICNEAIVTNPATLKEGDVVTSVWQERPEWAGNNTLVGLVWSADEAIRLGLQKTWDTIDAATKYNLPAAIEKWAEKAQEAITEAYEEADHEWKYR